VRALVSLRLLSRFLGAGVVLWALLAGSSTPAAAQNHPELNWQVLTTPNFRVIYHEGLETVAQRAAVIAEAAYEPVTELYDYKPSGPVRLILKDYDDYANGAAYFYHDAIEIWTSPLDHDYELRGTSDWLKNVITHEFVHIISLGAMRKSSQRVPAAFFEYFGYKEERNRDDVLTGAPDRLATYPLANTVVPMWLAEGVSQYQTSSVRHDHWDSHRDMILRTAVLNDRLLELDEMGVFGKKGFGNEFVYDHGYGLVTYIAETYGDDALRRISDGLSRWSTLDVSGAIERATGKDAPTVWEDWRDWMRSRYEAQVAAMGVLREGERLTDGSGHSNMRPQFSPDGQQLSYLSTGSRHYGPHSLVIRDMATGEDESKAPAVSSTMSWAPDGQSLVFVRKRAADSYGSRRADLFRYDLAADDRSLMSSLLWAPAVLTGVHFPESPHEQELTRGERSLYPAISPDGQRILYVRVSADGAQLVVRPNTAAVEDNPAPDQLGQSEQVLLSYDDGSQLYTPRWSPDGRQIVFSIFSNGNRHIARIAADAEDAAPEPVVITAGTDRDPNFSPAGDELLFISDVTGVFNVYALDLASDEIAQVTNVRGGAFFPTMNDSGSVVYAGYDADGFQLYQVSRAEAQTVTDGRFRPEGSSFAGLPAGKGTAENQPEHQPDYQVDSDSHRGSAAMDAGDFGRLGQGTVEPYGSEFLRTTLMPRLSFDEGHLKAGTYLSTFDALDRQSIFGALSVAPGNGDRDLYAVYKYRGFRPTLRLSYIHLRRHTSRRDSTEARDGIVTGMNFSLNRLTFGATGRLNRTSEVDLSLAYDRYDASLDIDVFVPRGDGRPGFELRAQRPVGYTYLNGFDLGLVYRHDSVSRRRDRSINPRGGRTVYFRYDRMQNWFIDGFDETNTSFLDETYLKLGYNQLTGEWREYVPLPAGSTLALRAYGGWIASEKVDDEYWVNRDPEAYEGCLTDGADDCGPLGDFFDFHLGGIPYMRGYTFYSIEGRKALMGQAMWRFPLRSDIGHRLGPIYFDKIYGALYGDVGKAWDGAIGDPDPAFGRKAPLRDVGGQLRFDLISFYSLPTRIEADLAYGLDEVGRQGPWKLYLTVLFGYLDRVDPGE
jgi:Tol biopolymer transport system component